jgi:hypothetical protein
MRHALLSICLLAGSIATAAAPFGIQVLDDTSGQPIPMVTLETVHGLRFTSDSSGLIAFDEPGMLQRRVFFSVKSPGYTFPKDNFGFAGLSLDTTPGATTTIKLVRTNIAERLYRLTGQGIYRDTLLLGKDAPISHPNLNDGPDLGEPAETMRPRSPYVEHPQSCFPFTAPNDAHFAMASRAVTSCASAALRWAACPCRSCSTPNPRTAPGAGSRASS